MERRSRALDDQDTLLTLPLSDFPNTSSATAKTTTNNNKDDDDLILIALPPKKDGGLTMEDLIRGKSVYILGNTSEKNVHTNNNLHPSAAVAAEQQQQDDGNNNNVGGSIEPIAARLIVEGEEGSSGKTLELTRVETSNTYIVVPPMLCKKNGEDNTTMDGDDNDDGISGSNNKRQKLLDSSSANTTSKTSNDELEKKKTKLFTMPARSVGLVPGEESPATFFLDPLHLKPGHFASKLRTSLSGWMYDPFDPPVVMEEESSEECIKNTNLLFGYTIPELAHICRTSQSEIEYAICNRIFGAVDALAIPSSSSTNNTRRYGMLSEEGRQTVAMAIVTAMLESDLDLVWKFPTTSSSEGKDSKEQTKGMQLSLLMEEVRSHWHRLEGSQDDDAPSSSSQPQQLEEEGPHLTDSQSQNFDSQSQFGTPSQFPQYTNDNNHQSLQLADEIIWHCLRPILHYDIPPGTSTTTKDTMPEIVQLIPDEVAKLAAHHVFLRGTPRSLSSASSQQQIGAGSAVWWEEDEFMEAWSMRLPSMSSKYEPRVELLKGVAICGMKEVDGGSSGEDGKQQVRQWQYFPETGQSLVPSIRIKSMFAMQDAWTLDEAVPYLEKFVVCNNEDGDGRLKPMVADLLRKYAKSVPMGTGEVKYVKA